MVDIAWLECAYVECYDRAAMAPLTEADFADLSGNSTLSLQPHLKLLDLCYLVDHLVLAIRYIRQRASPTS